MVIDTHSLRFDSLRFVEAVYLAECTLLQDLFGKQHILTLFHRNNKRSLNFD